MSETIERLLEDHRRFRNVLTAALQMARDYRDSTDEDSADHLFCLLDYLSGYPEKVHHPIEDQMFERVLNHDLTAKERTALQHNQQQHEQLESATAEISALFESLRDRLDIDQLLAALEKYATLQLDHMAFEESESFRIAQNRLSEQDWAELKEFFSMHADPLFDTADKTYAALYRHLVVDPGAPDPTAMSKALETYLSATLFGKH